MRVVVRNPKNNLVKSIDSVDWSRCEFEAIIQFYEQETNFIVYYN